MIYGLFVDGTTSCLNALSGNKNFLINTSISRNLYPIEKVYDKSSESLKFEKMGEYYGHFSIADTEGNTSEFDIQYDVHDQNPPVVYSYVNTVSGKTRENKSIVD